MTSPPPPPHPRTRRPAPLATWLRALRPARLPADARERLRVALGAALGIGVTALLSQLWAQPGPGPWLVAPLGASAVLVYGLPASPLAQPWAVVGGNTLSALVAVLCVWALGPSAGTAALAVGAAIGLMFALRCLHPPGGASALLVALNGVADWHFALFPVLVNSVILVGVGMLYNSATRRPYPHPQWPDAPPATRDAAALTLDAEFDAVLARHNQVLDVPRDELKALFSETRLAMHQRQLARLRCEDIMTRAPVTVLPTTPLHDAWRMFAARRIKAMPVVNERGQVVGILTPTDFVRTATTAAGEWFDAHVRAMQARTRPQGLETVADVMTPQVRVVHPHVRLADLLPLFAGTGHRHLPVVDGDGVLVGMVTQSDVVAALMRLEPPAA